jgi:ketol-acid reductoisomerase
MTKVKIGQVIENIVSRQEFSLAQAKDLLQSQTIAVLGYGSQGRAQALNLRDGGLPVIVGQRESSKTWDQAINDRWEPGKTLFALGEAVSRGNIIMCLLSDAGQKMTWSEISAKLQPGQTLCFAHGFAITYRALTAVVPPAENDVILVSPKGSGLTLRRNFEQGRGLNFSYAVFQNSSGQALEKALALGMCLGANYLLETTFEKEVFCNLTAERGILVGALAGMMEAQFNTLREHGHSPSESFYDTVEQLTQSLLPLLAEKGMDWLLANISTTAQRGALDWKEKFREVLSPVFNDLYQKVADGTEAKRVLEKNSQPEYKEELAQELNAVKELEIWKTGAVVRGMR